MFWTLGCLILAAYLVGSFPTGVVLSRRKYGLDVREMGSGNIGATNITRNFGWGAGITTFLIDFFKGFWVVRAAEYFFPQWPFAVTAAALAVVIGHCFSVFLKFGGGKGVATLLGCLAAVFPMAAGGMAVVYVALLLLTRISAIGSLGGIFFVVCYTQLYPPTFAVQCLVFGGAMLVLVRHRKNLHRLLGFQEFSAT